MNGDFVPAAPAFALCALILCPPAAGDAALPVPAGGIGTGFGAAGAVGATLPPSDRAVPHFSQKAASGSFTVPQAGQGFFPSSRAPHRMQKFAASLFSREQSGHIFIVFSPFRFRINLFHYSTRACGSQDLYANFGGLLLFSFFSLALPRLFYPLRLAMLDTSPLLKRGGMGGVTPPFSKRGGMGGCDISPFQKGRHEERSTTPTFQKGRHRWGATRSPVIRRDPGRLCRPPHMAPLCKGSCQPDG